MHTANELFSAHKISVMSHMAVEKLSQKIAGCWSSNDWKNNIPVVVVVVEFASFEL